MLFSKRFRSDGHVREFVVDEADERGWQVREERDCQVVKRTWFRDWDRVESAIAKFSVQGLLLREAGWTEISTSS
jgi:hypothetical protein